MVMKAVLNLSHLFTVFTVLIKMKVPSALFIIWGSDPHCKLVKMIIFLTLQGSVVVGSTTGAGFRAQAWAEERGPPEEGG